MSAFPHKELDCVSYTSLIHFLYRHMKLLDEGLIEEWAACFTDDGVFATESVPSPVRGRESIVVGAKAAKEQLDADGISRRHWLGMTEAWVADDGKVIAHSYALTLQTTAEAQATMRFFNICHDTLVQKSDGTWLIEARSITRS